MVQFTWIADPLAKTFPVIPTIAAVMARINLAFNAASLKKKGNKVNANQRLKGKERFYLVVEAC